MGSVLLYHKKVYHMLCDSISLQCDDLRF